MEEAAAAVGPRSRKNREDQREKEKQVEERGGGGRKRRLSGSISRIPESDTVPWEPEEHRNEGDRDDRDPRGSENAKWEGRNGRNREREREIGKKKKRKTNGRDSSESDIAVAVAWRLTAAYIVGGLGAEAVRVSTRLFVIRASFILVYRRLINNKDYIHEYSRETRIVWRQPYEVYIYTCTNRRMVGARTRRIRAGGKWTRRFSLFFLFLFFFYLRGRSLIRAGVASFAITMACSGAVTVLRDALVRYAVPLCTCA